MILFKYPGESQTNYIKRLIGLPGETIRIQDGEIWVRPPGTTVAATERSRLAQAAGKLLAMLQPVFDNDYMPRIAQEGWPMRWYSDAAPPVGAWASEDSTVFHTDGAAAGENWLRYHHLVPSQWRGEDRPAQVPPPRPRLTPQLITDFTAYDTGRIETDPFRFGATPNLNAGPFIGWAIWPWRVRRNWKPQRRVGARIVQGWAPLPVPLRRVHRPGDPLNQRSRHASVAARRADERAWQGSARPDLLQLRRRIAGNTVLTPISR